VSLSPSTFDVAQWLQQTSLTALADCNREPISTSYVGSGQVAWDDCCGTLVVVPERVFRSSAFPAEDTDEVICFDGLIAIEFSVMLLRCIPVIDERGRAPKDTAMEVAYANLLGDAAVIYNALTSQFPDYWERTNPSQTFIGAQGGCIGVETRLIVGLEQSQFGICCAEPVPHDPGDPVCKFSASNVVFEPCEGLESTNVQDAICELANAVAPTTLPASDITFESCDDLLSTNVQDAICELASAVPVHAVGSFFDNTDQVFSANTNNPMRLNTTSISYGIAVNNLTEITVSEDGVYTLDFSAQLHHRGGGGSGEEIDIWIAKNGVAVPSSATKLIVSNAKYLVASWDFMLELNANDYIEFYYRTNNASIAIEHVPATANVPAIPSLIVNMSQIRG
jgi:hypothetical protein